jgi:DNA-binding beta-propeller fold protein YncE
MDTMTPPSPAHCPECAPRPPLRNHWFWGKCIVPRDLTDEQSFFLEKLRLHQQRLHGIGIVCGLELKQHPNITCQDRLVLLTPGSAVDCCGHDILVLEQDVIDLSHFPAVAALVATPDGKPHTLRFCIRYRECPTEEVPVLYDECACDDTRCAPNRILETYSVEVELDPPPIMRLIAQPSFTRVTTLLIAGTQAVALDAAGGRILVLAGTSLFELDATTHALGVPRTLAAAGRTMTIAADFSRLDLILGGDATDDATLSVLAIGGPVPVATAAERHAALAGSLNSGVTMAETSDGQLVAVIETKGGVRRWAAGIADPATLADQVDIGSATHGLAISSDATKAYVAQPGTAALQVLALTTPGLPATSLPLTGGAGFTGKGDNLALVATTGPDRLAVLDHATPRLHLVDPASGTVEGSVTLDHPPVDLVIAPGGHWALVIEDDGTNGWVQAVNLHLLRQGQPVTAGTPQPLGPAPGHPVLSPDGHRLYVPIKDGVAVLDVTDADCASLLTRDRCPDCLTADCLVLATVENWQPGFRLEDLGPTPVVPAQDAANKVARLDNGRDRTVLPSTQAIAAALECLIANGGGGAPGPTGPPGPPGPPGKDGTNGTNGANGTNGTDGKDAVDPTLTHICDINWKHATSIPVAALTLNNFHQDGFGVAIAFSNPVETPAKVQTDDLNDISFSVLMEHVEADPNGTLLRTCWCSLPTTGVFGVKMNDECVLPKGGAKVPPGSTCDGAIYPFSATAIREEIDNRGTVKQPPLPPGVRIKVRVHGSLIRADSKNRALDAINLPLWVPNRVSGDGIAGGTFEDWFIITL